MSKNDSINTKQMLMCIMVSFKQFGIDYIQFKDFINAKQDMELQNGNLIRLLFDLSLLHMFDYDIDLGDLKIQTSEEDMITVILAHLIESECPLLLELDDGLQYGLNFQSSRVLIMIVGWIMAVSDYFGHIGTYIIKKSNKKQKESQQFHKQKPSIKQAKTNIKSQITVLCKSIRVALSNLNNLKKKKIKLHQKILNILKQSGQTISLSQFINNNETGDLKRLEKLKRLVQFIKSQKTYMRFRNHFWAWMQSVIKKDKDPIRDNPDFQFEQNSQSTTSLIYNLNSLDDFMDKMEHSKSMMNQYMPIFQHIKNMYSQKSTKVSQSQKKQLATFSKVVQSELNKILPNYDEQNNHKSANSFVGLQLKRLFYQTEQNVIENKKESVGYNKALDLCRDNIHNLNSLKFI